MSNRATSNRLVAVLLVSGLMLLAGSANVFAKDPPGDYVTRNVAVLPFIGDSAPEFESAVAEAVWSHHKIEKADADKLVAAAEKTGSSINDLRGGIGITPHCNRLRIDAVVAGEVFLEEGTYVMTLKVYDGETGDLLGYFDWPSVKEPPFSKKFAEEVMSRLAREAIKDSYAGAEGAAVAAGDDDDDSGYDDDDDDDDGKKPKKPKKPPASRPATGLPPRIIANIGLGPGLRFYDVSAANGNRSLNPGTFPALHLNVEVLPLGFFLEGLPARLGVRIGGEVGFPRKRFKRGPAGCDPDTMANCTLVDIPNHYVHVFGAVFFRYPLPFWEERIEIIPSVGYSTTWIGQTGAEAANDSLAARFGLGALRLGGRVAVRPIEDLSIWAGGHFNLVLVVGPKDAGTAGFLQGDATDYYGADGTRANSVGFNVELGGAYRLPIPAIDLHVGIQLFLRRYRAKFTGVGNNTLVLTDPLATDLSLGGIVFVGYLFP